MRADENIACDVCGRYGAYEIDDRRLCLDCYERSGSCCLEFGGDDLWQRRKSGQRTES